MKIVAKSQWPSIQYERLRKMFDKSAHLMEQSAAQYEVNPEYVAIPMAEPSRRRKPMSYFLSGK